jgi:hypothetical protein
MSDVALVKRNIGKMIDQGAPQEDIDAYLASEGVSTEQLKGPQRSTAEMATRLAGNVGAGFNRSAVETVTALPELVSTGFRKLGIPAPDAGFYTNKLQSGVDAVLGAPPQPETTAEKFAHGAGRGAADAMSIAIPAAATARMASGPVTRGVAQALSAAPVAHAA